MKQRTKSDWRTLIKEQASSHLSVAEFCKQHNIGQTYFYKRRSELQPGNTSKPKSGFVKINKLASETPSTASIKIQYQSTQISFPASISPKWLAEFIKALA